MLAVLVAAAAMAAGLAPAVAGEADRYWLGPSFEGYAISGQEDRSVFYGGCEPGPDGGCAVPVQVASESICDPRPLALSPRPSAMKRIRGVPALRYGDSVEVLTGRTNVVIYAEPARAWRAVSALRLMRAGDQRSGRLAPPRMPRWALRELKLVRRLHRQVGSARALRSRLGISRSAIVMRLRLARLLGDKALSGVPPAKVSPGDVIKDRAAHHAATQGLAAGGGMSAAEASKRARRHAKRLQRC